MARLTHIDDEGAARMVDIGFKPETAREAIAEGKIRMSDEARSALVSAKSAKGDAIAVARVAGIMAAKKTGELIPLCHSLALDRVSIDFTAEEDGIRVVASVALTARTGVEMEAMTAVTVALLTLYDMGKAIDKGMQIEGVRLFRKTGGRSGDWEAPS